tara:strand:+ start:8116 stop:8712 length:597 start_codon:yes stop_codon:yes gene_type:complete
MATKRKRINENNRKKSTPKTRSTVQRTLPDSVRELDNRKYDQGYALDAKEVCSDKRKEKNQRSGKGLSDPVESLVGNLSNVPENPPIPLFEANSIIEIAESFWGLSEGSIRGRSRVFHVLWPRYVVCGILRSKGYTYQAVADVLDRDHGSIMNACEQYKAITETLPKYKEQATQFDRYLWSKLTANSRNGYNTVALRT